MPLQLNQAVTGWVKTGCKKKKMCYQPNCFCLGELEIVISQTKHVQRGYALAQQYGGVFFFEKNHTQTFLYLTFGLYFGKIVQLFKRASTLNNLMIDFI